MTNHWYEANNQLESNSSSLVMITLNEAGLMVLRKVVVRLLALEAAQRTLQVELI